MRTAPVSSRLRSAAITSVAAAITSLTAGCFLTDTGLEPPTDLPYFPTALAVSPGRTALYVINSDFDLQYNAGTVQAIDLASPAGGLYQGGLRPRLLALLDALNVPGAQASTACKAAGLEENDNRIIDVSPCKPLVFRSDRVTPPGASPVKAFATIGAFASGATIMQRPDGPGLRLFVTVRGDPSVTWFELADDRPDGAGMVPPAYACADRNDVACFDCAADGEVRRCGDTHRIGVDPFDNPRNLTLPVEPAGIDIASDAESILVAHQTEKAVSLSINRWTNAPVLSFVLSNLPDGPTDVTRVPIPRLSRAQKQLGHLFSYEPGFLVTYRAAAQLDLFRYHDDALASPPRPFVTRASATGIGLAADGKDSRGIAIDDGARVACEDACCAEAQCGDADLACLRACADVPLRVFVANRSPASLVVGTIETKVIENGSDGGDGAFDVVKLTELAPLAVGASKVALGKVLDMDGKLATRVFAVAFDSRTVFSYDPEGRRIDASIRTGRGPHPIAFDVSDGSDGDVPHAFMYVGHFTDSYLSVVDLDMRRATFGSMFASMSSPNPPRSSR